MKAGRKSYFIKKNWDRFEDVAQILRVSRNYPLKKKAERKLLFFEEKLRSIMDLR